MTSETEETRMFPTPAEYLGWAYAGSVESVGSDDAAVLWTMAYSLAVATVMLLFAFTFSSTALDTYRVGRVLDLSMSLFALAPLVSVVTKKAIWGIQGGLRA